MMRSIGAIALIAALQFSAPMPTAAAHAAKATDLSAHRRIRHTHYAYRPAYYGRPSIYAPAPFFPLPPLFGYGWEWW